MKILPLISSYTLFSFMSTPVLTFNPCHIFLFLSGYLMTRRAEYFILAYQTRFSRFSPVLTNLILPTLVDKKRITTCCQYTGCIGGHITQLLRRWELISFMRRHKGYQLSICPNIPDVKVEELDLLMVTPKLHSSAGDQKLCKKKNLSWLFGTSGSLFGIMAKPCDAKKQWPWDGFFYPLLTPMIDSYIVLVLPNKQNEEIKISYIIQTFCKAVILHGYTDLNSVSSQCTCG